MIKKMEKQIYVAPHLEVLLYDVETVLGENSYPVIGPGEPGVDLGKENYIVFSDFTYDENVWDLWAENENEEE